MNTKTNEAKTKAEAVFRRIEQHEAAKAELRKEVLALNLEELAELQAKFVTEDGKVNVKHAWYQFISRARTFRKFNPNTNARNTNELAIWLDTHNTEDGTACGSKTKAKAAKAAKERNEAKALAKAEDEEAANYVNLSLLGFEAAQAFRSLLVSNSSLLASAILAAKAEHEAELQELAAKAEAAKAEAAKEVKAANELAAKEVKAANELAAKAAKAEAKAKAKAANELAKVKNASGAFAKTLAEAEAVELSEAAKAAKAANELKAELAAKAEAFAALKAKAKAAKAKAANG